MKGATQNPTEALRAAYLKQEHPERILLLLAVFVMLLHVGVWFLFFRQTEEIQQQDLKPMPFKLEVSMLPPGVDDPKKPSPNIKPELQQKPEKSQENDTKKTPDKSKEKEPSKNPDKSHEKDQEHTSEQTPEKTQTMDMAELQQIIKSNPNPQVSRNVKVVPGTRTTQAVSSAVFPSHRGAASAKDNFPISDEHNPSPEYPEMALFLGYQGTTVVRVHVSGKGQTKGVEVVQSSHHKVLDESAAKAISKWRFSATNHDDSVIILVNFIIRN
jgi:protein TonB